MVVVKEKLLRNYQHKNSKLLEFSENLILSTSAPDFSYLS